MYNTKKITVVHSVKTKKIEIIKEKEGEGEEIKDYLIPVEEEGKISNTEVSCKISCNIL